MEHLKSMLDGTYVYVNEEVKLTGRYAKKSITTARNNDKEYILVEIKPIDKDMDWKKFVKMAELYTISQLEEENDA